MVNRIILNETSYFGRGAIKKLPEEIKARNFLKVFIVSDKNIVDAGLVSEVANILEDNNISYEVFSNVVPNPTVSNVLEGLDNCKQSEADLIIAIGGGSAIDTAKAIAIIHENPEFSDVISLNGVANTKNKALPIIAIPTTAGTAAEVTINYVITDTEQPLKMVCVDPNDIPIIAVIDPNLMDTMPKSVAASTGMDALTHALEGFITKSAWDMSDMFHEKAMKLIYENLEDAVNKKDKAAIENVAYGQYIAGMGFSNVGLGIVHSMAHALGALYDTPHGLANAMILPHVLKFNGPVCADKFKRIAYIFNLFVAGKSDEEIINKVVEAVRDLGRKLDIPQTLSEIGVKFEDLEKLSELAINDICTGGNPREVTKEQILELFNSFY